MITDHFKIAVTNLTKRKLRSWLTLLGILIGIASVVALIGLGDGLKLAINSQFGVSSTEVITIQAGGVTGAGPPGTGVVNPLTEQDAEEIEKLNSVESTISRIIKTGSLEFNDRLIFGFAMNVPDGEDRKFAYEVLDIEALQGRLLKDGDNDKVVLGYNFYDDKVGLGKPVGIGNTVIIQGEKFEVVGITKKKGSFIFDNIVHMNDKPLKDLWNQGDDVSVIVARVKDKSIMPKAKEDIEKLLRKLRDVKEGEEDFSVETPESIMNTINGILTGVQVFIAIIAGISILVGAVGIINTMLTAVLERRSQIGIMKAIGAKNKDIFLLFFIESGLLGLVGGIIGVTIGTLISYFGTLGINNFVGASTSPSLGVGLIFFTLLGSFILGSVAGIVPAMRAANQNPVDALRG